MKKDVISKDIIKELFIDILKYIVKIDISNSHIDFIDKELLRIEKREADIIARIDNSYIIHLEIQNNNHSKMHYRMLRYYVDIIENYEMPIKQFLIYIGKESAKFKDYISYTNLRYNYSVIDIKEIDCDILLRQDNPEALVLAILCDFKNKNPRDIVGYIINKLKSYKDYKKYISMLEILSTNRDLKDIIKEQEMLSTVTYQDLPSWEIGLEQGMEKGKEIGMEKGKEIGKEIGIKLGLEEGYKKARDEMIMKMLKLGISKEVISKELNLDIEYINSIKG